MSPLPAWAPQGSGAWGAAFLRPTLGAGRDGGTCRQSLSSQAGPGTPPNPGQGRRGRLASRWVLGLSPRGAPRLPPSPQLERAALNLPAALGILGCGVRTLQVFPMTSPEGLSPGGGLPPPTPEPEPEPLSGRPPLPAPSAARGHIGPGAGAKPGVPPPRLSPTSRQPQLELALTLHWAWTTSSGDFSLLCPRQPLAAEM